MKNFQYQPVLKILLIFFLGHSVAMAALSPVEIMEKAHHTLLYQGDMKRARVKMTITDSNGGVRKRQFYSLRLDKESSEQSADRGKGDQFYYIYFRRPGDIKKTAFLVHKYSNKDDDRWLYLPDLDLVKRISSGDKRTSFVGSTFFYEDISGRSLNDDSHELLSEDETYFVLKSTPHKADGVEFSSYKTWIHKTSFIPVKIEYFDKNNELYRFCENQKVEMVEGRPTVVKGLMRDIKHGEQTVIESSRISYDFGMPADIFTERFLRHPPSQYFK